MTVIAVTSANIGTKLATGADTKIVSITLNQPAANSDMNTPLVLIDAASAPTFSAFKTLFSASLMTLAFVFGYKPNWPGTPGLTAPAWPMSLGSAINAAFNSGVFVQNCPANVTFNVTTG